MASYSLAALPFIKYRPGLLINQSIINFNVPISINKNLESRAWNRYATFFNVRQCETDESLAGP